MTVDCRPDLAALWPVAHDVALDHVILLRRSSSDLHEHSTCQPLAAAGSGFGAEIEMPRRLCVSLAAGGVRGLHVSRRPIKVKLNCYWCDNYILHFKPALNDSSVSLKRMCIIRCSACTE